MSSKPGAGEGNARLSDVIPWWRQWEKKSWRKHTGGLKGRLKAGGVEKRCVDVGSVGAKGAKGSDWTLYSATLGTMSFLWHTQMSVTNKQNPVTKPQKSRSNF